MINKTFIALLLILTAPLNLTHAAETWSNPEEISTNSGRHENPRIAINDNGDAIATWLEYSNTKIYLWLNNYSSSTHSWAGPKIITENAGTQSISIDNNGNALLIWSQSNNMNNIWGSYYNVASKTWTTPYFMDAGIKAYSSYALPFIDNNGNATVLWMINDPKLSSIWSNTYDAKMHQWSKPVRIETNGNFSNPSYTSDNHGNIFIYWIRSSNNNKANSSLAGRYYNTAKKTLGPIIDINVERHHSHVRAAMDAKGDTRLAWVHNNHILTSRCRLNSQQCEPSVKLDDNPLNNSNAPQLATNMSGNSVVIWTQMNNRGYSRIKASQYSIMTNTWSNPITIAIDATTDILLNNTHTHQLAIDNANNIIAAWNYSDHVLITGERNLLTAHYRYDNDQWDINLITQYKDEDNASDMQIVGNGNGDAITVWVKFNDIDKSHTGILSSHLKK